MSACLEQITFLAIWLWNTVDNNSANLLFLDSQENRRLTMFWRLSTETIAVALMRDSTKCELSENRRKDLSIKSSRNLKVLWMSLSRSFDKISQSFSSQPPN